MDFFDPSNNNPADRDVFINNLTNSFLVFEYDRSITALR